MSKLASSVKVIHRRSQLRASRILEERATAEPKIEFIWDTVVTQIEGDGAVRQLRLKNTGNDRIATLELAGVFVAIGSKPNSTQWRELLPLDEEGYIITNELMETKIPGIFSAGDVRHNSARQAITAAWRWCCRCHIGGEIFVILSEVRSFMKVVLLEDITGKGKAGEIKEVSKGYAKNFLLPRGLALIATPTVMKQVESRLKKTKLEESIDRERLVELAQQIEGKEIRFKARIGAGERLFALQPRGRGALQATRRP